MSEVSVHQGDSREVLKGIADASIDACVTDPPYALVSIGKRFGKPGAAPPKSEGASGVYARAASGFMGQQWDTGETAFAPEFWSEVYRVLKPGGHVVAFSGTRTYHRMACAIEDAGFDIRDQGAWIYGSGFPKSHDVSKAIDKRLGAERKRVRHKPRPATSGTMAGSSDTRPWIEEARQRGFHEVAGPEAATPEAATPEAATPEAATWSGWGTALKPAWEPICIARKPLDGTVAGNVLAYGTGALNIDACRSATGLGGVRDGSSDHLGRWPANVVHDGSDEVLAAFPDAPGQQRAVTGDERSRRTVNAYGDFGATRGGFEPRGDAGSAARFFYTAKADAVGRLGSKHPTVKPVDLMRWLCRMITPPGGVVLDPFAGSGTTGVAALLEGFDCILVEREAQYVADIQRRIAWARGEGALTQQEISRQPTREPFSDGLFANHDDQRGAA